LFNLTCVYYCYNQLLNYIYNYGIQLSLLFVVYSDEKHFFDWPH